MKNTVNTKDIFSLAVCLFAIFASAHAQEEWQKEGDLEDVEIEIVKEQFARVLVGMHHVRIDYPVSSGGITAELAAE